MPGRVEVPRSPLRPPVYGLVAAARDATNDTDRWENGITWQPNCAVDNGTWRACTDDEASGGPTQTIAARAVGLVEWDAYSIWSGDVCSTLGGLTQDRVERAQEQLQNAQTKALELILQNGLAGATTPHLRDSNVDDLSPAGASSPLVYALAALEEAAADAGTPFIHCTIATATLWYSARALEKVGNLLYTALGTVVVPGAGYTGANPAGTIDATGETAYAYVTGQAAVRLGPISVVGDERSINRETNTWEVRAERLALASFDPCVQAGINVNLCETFCVSASS